MRRWLKLGYFTDAGEADADYWLRRHFVGDGPGRTSSRWDARPRPPLGQKFPPYGPKYGVGDRLVIYVTKAGRCPAIVEVTEEPRWDPHRVDQDDRPGDGDRWGVVTPIRGLYGVPLAEAPLIEHLDVSRTTVMRKGHVQLAEANYLEAERLIAGNRPPRGRSRPARNVPLEAGQVEGYVVAQPAAVRQAVRAEARLVRDYVDQLSGKGDRIYRKEILVPGGGEARMYSDVFNETRDQLVEAKASTARNDVRMAIGQLADYGRFVSSARRAILLDSRPLPDLLRLLESQAIAAIWREGKVFADNAGGEFV